MPAALAGPGLPGHAPAGASPAPERFGRGVWSAFDRALARAGRAADPPPDSRADERTPADLRAAVRRRLDGDTAPDAAPWPAAAMPMLRRVRRYFAEELRSATPVETFGALHVFNALALLAGTAERPAPPADAPDRSAALDLAVEVAHDIRSPLAAMLFLADMLRTGHSGPVSELQQRQLGMIYEAALGLNQLAGDLMDFVRGDCDIVDREPVAFSLAEMVAGVADLVRPTAEEKQIAVRYELPDAPTRIGSPAALSRIVLNLTTNAIRHTNEGTVSVSIRELTPARVVVSVEDSGQDIPADIVPQLFQPYRATRPGASSFSGSGLGLAICHRLVDALGGELQVTTGGRRGARFWFELDLPRA